MKDVGRVYNFLSFFIYWLLCCIPFKGQAYNLRQFSNKNGLSNSAILSLYQDNKGVIWIGSCDGLNIFDGTDIYLFHSIDSPNKTLLSGNLINQIYSSEEHILWIQTNYGLDRLDTRSQACQSFIDFKDNNFMASSNDGTLFLLKDDGRLYYFQDTDQTFKTIDGLNVNFSQVRSMTVDKHDILWIFGTGNEIYSYRIHNGDNGNIDLSEELLFRHSNGLRWAFAEKDVAYFIDDTYSFYEYDFNNCKQYFIADLKPEIEARGEVSSVIKQGNDYYIGFKNSGLIVLKYMPDKKIKYQVCSTGINCGIFCLMSDRFQDIVWIGTDGQGVYMYFNDMFSITNARLDTPPYQISQPVRALYYDQEQTLWLGTKGGGILQIHDYYPDNKLQTNSFALITASNSSLTDNSVYCFAPSRKGLLWIGTESGLNYYSYSSKQLKELSIMADGKKVKYIHSVNELNDSTLWISTVGEGIVKVILNLAGHIPSVKSAKRIVMDNGRVASNYFFTSYQENDSILWFGNRGYGAYRMNTTNEAIETYCFDNIVNSRMANDIFAIYRNDKGYWLGTSSGLLYFDRDYVHQSKADLFFNNTVHGILEDYRKNLWVSTNQGLIRFNPDTGTGHVYNGTSGLETTEFSDGAFYKDNRTGTLFFGGINGFVAIKPSNISVEAYMPPIYLKGLSIFGKEQNINQFLEVTQKGHLLRLSYNQNFLQLDFMTIDYINGNSYSYYYKIEGVNDQWIENGRSSNIVLSNLAAGDYTLLVKYKNYSSGSESSAFSVNIHIAPPWYTSSWAYVVYMFLLMGLFVMIIYKIVYSYRRKQVRMMEKMNQQKKEEIYESKLRFFTNITHEFCTPLTLIYGPCEKILSYSGTSAYIRKYAQMIHQNAEKLNSLILELLEFRRLETGHKTLLIQYLPVSQKLEEIACLFQELAKDKNINYQFNIQSDIEWNTDLSCFSKIANNLISNAFKYTPDGGVIIIQLKIGQELVLQVSNSGKGIPQEDLSKIFDRYKILDSIEISKKNSRTGLGLAICKSMITLLNGDIKVESVLDGMTTFTVTLPSLSLTKLSETSLVGVEDTVSNIIVREPLKQECITNKFDDNKLTIMVIDDDPSMLWFVSEIFVDKYNVFSFDNANDALLCLEQQQPVIIISDVMMPNVDGLSFVQRVKQNKLWCHIPLILLSALHNEDDQVKGLESGADAYVTKPFNVKYLEKLVSRLIVRETELKEYYNSSFSSFTIENGKIQNKEDQDFINRMFDVIKQHIANPNLSVELLSKELGYSSRQFYRKLKPITEKSPADIIRECRIHTAEKMLLEQNFTIEEIMDRTGFTNRGTFYKMFSQCYGMPPLQYRKSQKEKMDKERQQLLI